MKKIAKLILLPIILLFLCHSVSYSQGIRYTGSYTPSAAIVLNGASNQVISGLSFTGLNSTSISLKSCSNITIKNCKFSKSNQRVIVASCAKNLIIQDCVFDSVADGILIVGDPNNSFNNYTSSGVKITHNYFKNLMGGFPGHHGVQFNGVNGGDGNQVNYNSFENIHLQSFTDDMISMYASRGSANDSIEIIGNWFRGGDWDAKHSTGSGIMIGDNGSAYIHVKNNILVNTVGTAIGNAGATHTVVENNIIYQSQALANPNNQAGGCYMFNFNSVADTTTCNQNTWRNNRGLSYLYNGNETCFAQVSVSWNHCVPAIEFSTNIIDTKLNENILPLNIARDQAETIATPPPTSTSTTFKMKPNPRYNISIAVSAAPIPNNAKIIIYNTNGKIIVQQSIISLETMINTSIMPLGVYLVKLFNNDLVIDVRKIRI
jgi:hypothetical protein